MIHEKPVRVQRKRSRGWTMPPNTVYVGRPSEFGNPFPKSLYGEDGAIKLYESYLRKAIINGVIDVNKIRGKNLSCWCNEDKPCHADVLLKLANQ